MNPQGFRGLGDPPVVIGATREYRETSDALAGYLPGRWTPCGHDEAVVAGSLLWADYLAWADEENLAPRDRWTRRTFFAALEERGLTKKRSASGVAFEGVRRARAADADACEAERAEAAPLAHSSAEPAHLPASGPSLDDVF